MGSEAAVPGQGNNWTHADTHVPGTHRPAGPRAKHCSAPTWDQVPPITPALAPEAPAMGGTLRGRAVPGQEPAKNQRSPRAREGPDWPF